MKPLDKIERLAEIADSINYYTNALERRKAESERYIRLEIMTSGNWFEQSNKIYERLLRILELKYNRVLTEIK